MIEIEHLTHDYSTGLLRKQRVRALDDVSLSIGKGEMVALLGLNGAGKTTLFRMLLGLVRPVSGKIRICGQASVDVGWKKRLGYLPEEPTCYEQLTPREFLVYAGELSGMTRGRSGQAADELLARIGLDAKAAGRALRTLSKGMLQRVGLAQALINDPDILFLDEPMSGLDPLGRRLVRELIVSARKAGKTIIFSTHILGDVEQLGERVVLLDHGRLIADTTVKEIESEGGRPLSMEEWFVRMVERKG